jgi:uncharacterized repeat protein (TIGR02543 family)
MKKLVFGVTASIVISLVFISCPNEPGTDGHNPYNPNQKTIVVFDNTYGICTALVYDDYRRRDMDRVAEIPAGQCSAELEWTPSTSTPFYFAYRITLKNISGFTVDFVPEVGKDQKAVRLDANTRTVIPIPVLDDAVSSQEQVLSHKSFLNVQNSSAYSFQLHRGVSMIRPDNSPDSGVVNSNERAPYTINPGRSSDFSLLVGTDFKPFPASPERFEAGNFYSYQFTDSVSLNTQVSINLDNMDIQTYTVIFNANGGNGTVPASKNVRAASAITLPDGSVLINGDKIFGGWGVDMSGTGTVYSAGSRYTVTGDIILYAKWYPAGTTLYTVTFDSAGGSETASQRMVSDAVVIRPADPIKAGYTFGGWYSDSGMQTLYDFTTPVTGNLTLYAAWSANKYTVTFNANGASGTAPAAVTVDYGSSITLPGAGGLSITNGTFLGWNTEDDGTGTGYVSGAQYTVNADVTLFAMWDIVEPPPDGLLEMVLVPGGSFQMGTSSGGESDGRERPIHTVTLTGFYLGKYAVTQAQYETVMGTNPSYFTTANGRPPAAGETDGNRPVEQVSWYDALIFCNRLSIMEGLTPAYRINNSTNPEAWGTVPTSSSLTWNNVEVVSNSTGYRMPTEAEWEYAAKGGNGSPGNYAYAGSDNVDTVAWYSDNSGSITHTVGTKAPNDLGLYGMSGNILEWCWDRYGNYSSEAQVNPTGASSESDRVARGGCWSFSADGVRSAYRYYNYPSFRNYGVGLRLVRPNNAAAMAPIISVQPMGGTYSLNVQASPLTVQARVSGGGTLSYQWYRNTVNSSSDGTLISGATSSSYTPPTNTAGTLYYYVVVTNTGSTVTTVSNAAAVVVTVGGTTGIVIPQGGTRININTQAELEAIRSHIDDPAYNNGKNAYVLEQDITLTGTWTPIGYVQSVDSGGHPTGGIHAFSGNFYGNGHTIRNLVLPGGSIHYIGLFGYIENALIQDVQVELGENVISVTNGSAQWIGIIAGAHKNSVIRNCGVYSQSGITVNGTGTNHLDVAGISFGIYPTDGNRSSIIENCYVSMNMTITNGGTHITTSGITSRTNIVRNCYYIGNLTGTGQYAEVFGVSFEADVVEKSYNAGTVTNNASSSSYTSTAGIGREHSISNCVTLMERIDHVNGTNYARIQSANFSATLTNNYAYAGILVKGATVTSNDANSKNGLDKTAVQLKQRSTYESGLGWDFNNVWEMGPSSYPFPILKWQNGVVKLPPGFTVIGSSETLTASTATEFSSALSTIRSSSNDDFIIAITADFSLSPQDLTLAAYRNKRITLKGNTASRAISLSGQGSLFTVGADVELALEDIVLVGISNNNTSLVKVNASGMLALNSGGKVTGNTYGTSVKETGGAGIYVDGGTLEIAGGEISGNTLSGSFSGTTYNGDIRGGGVYAANGSNVLMTGGVIRNNTITNTHTEHGGAFGGGICIYVNTRFEMFDGIIEGNAVNDRSTSWESWALGGGVGVREGASFYLRGGKIRNNTVNATASGSSIGEAYGGGVCSWGNGHNFIMSGGVINGNRCTSSSNPNSSPSPYIAGAYGGGVHLNVQGFENTSFVKTGGIIYGNEVNGNDADGIPLKNTAQSESGGLGGGHAVFLRNNNPNSRRNTTVGETDNLYSNGSTLVDGTAPVVVPGTIGVTVAMWDKYGDGWDGSAALRINVNGNDLSANARLGSGGGPGYHTFTVNPGDVVRFYWVNGGTYDYECAFAVYYSANSPNPAFNPTSGTTDSSRLLISKQYGSSGSVGNGTLMGSFTVP